MITPHPILGERAASPASPCPSRHSSRSSLRSRGRACRRDRGAACVAPDPAFCVPARRRRRSPRGGACRRGSKACYAHVASGLRVLRAACRRSRSRAGPRRAPRRRQLTRAASRASPWPTRHLGARAVGIKEARTSRPDPAFGAPAGRRRRSRAEARRLPRRVPSDAVARPMAKSQVVE